MTDKHAPERWEAIGGLVRTVPSANDRGGMTGGYLVAEVPMSVESYLDVARLIATAPEMLNALELLLGGECPDCKGWGEVAYFGELVPCKCGGNFKYTPTERQISSAKAALAKARGDG